MRKNSYDMFKVFIIEKRKKSFKLFVRFKTYLILDLNQHLLLKEQILSLPRLPIPPIKQLNSTEKDEGLSV